MVALGLVFAYFSYGQLIYGWTLLKGWDVTWRELMSPINPYQWPGKGDPPAIPAGQILPGGAGAAQLGGTPPAGSGSSQNSGAIGIGGAASAARAGLQQGLFP